LRALKYNDVKQFIENLGYILIDDEYYNNNQKLTIKDKQGYYYITKFIYLKTNRKPSRFIKSNLYTIYNINLWCKLNNKPFKLISKEYINNRNKMKWQCLKENCKEVFLNSWDAILQGKGCGVCHGKQVGKFNCLAVNNPELAKEWDYSKNYNLTPYDVTVGSKRKVWWKCKKNHEWKSTVSRRSSDNNCPYCSGQLPSKNYNLLLNNSKLCEEWNYNKNKTNPDKYTPYSSKKVWWICKLCNFEWYAQISHRNNNRGCPSCNTSKGERKIVDWLELNNINYKLQKYFKDLKGLKGRFLFYDFYLPSYNLLIEYQGEQHYNYNKMFHKDINDLQLQQYYDEKKRRYAKDNDINLLEICYINYNDIDNILLNTLK